MSLSTQTLKRLPKIKDGLIKGLNRTQIGQSCGVTEKTIDRDMGTWVQSGLFETWIKEEFLRLHPIILKDYPETAYREVARLVGKMLTRRMELKEEVKIEETVTLNVTETEDQILSKAAAILNRKTKPHKIH